MNIRQACQVITLCRVHTFLEHVVTAIAQVDLGAAPHALSRAIDTIRDLKEQHATTITAARDAANTVDLLRHDLWTDAMHRVIEMARDSFADIPELAALTLPRRDCNVGVLVLTAYTMADVVTRHHARFIGEGLPPYTAQNLRSLASRIDAKHTARDRFRRAAAADTATIAAAVQQGLRAVRHIDAALTAAYADRPLFMALWNHARRFTRAELVAIANTNRQGAHHNAAKHQSAQ